MLCKSLNMKTSTLRAHKNLRASDSVQRWPACRSIATTRPPVNLFTLHTQTQALLWRLSFDGPDEIEIEILHSSVG